MSKYVRKTTKGLRRATAALEATYDSAVQEEKYVAKQQAEMYQKENQGLSDNLFVRLKTEIQDLTNKLETINQLKQVEKTLQKRLKIVTSLLLKLEEVTISQGDRDVLTDVIDYASTEVLEKPASIIKDGVDITDFK